MVVQSQEFPGDWLLGRFPEILAAIERDLGGLAAALSEHHAYDGYQKFPLSRYENTSLVQDHWRPIRCDQQIVAPFWNEGAPVGYFAVLRSHMEPTFTEEEFRRAEELRVLAERALRGVAAFGQGDLARTLEALSQAFPYPAYLLDSRGDLRWMSDEGEVRLGLEASRFGGGQLVRGNAALEALVRHARRALRDPASDVEAGLRRERLLRSGERVAVRRFADQGGTRLLLALVPAMAAMPGDGLHPSPVSVPGLGAAESRVAQLAAQGFTVLNIATQLGVSEATVRTHLRRVYVKLGVHGRAELACVLLRTTPPVTPQRVDGL